MKQRRPFLDYDSHDASPHLVVEVVVCPIRLLPDLPSLEHKMPRRTFIREVIFPHTTKQMHCASYQTLIFPQVKSPLLNHHRYHHPLPPIYRVCSTLHLLITSVINDTINRHQKRTPMEK
eukprot:PhF_6_TR35996/c0_g1_i2/m.52140